MSLVSKFKIGYRLKQVFDKLVRNMFPFVVRRYNLVSLKKEVIHWETFYKLLYSREINIFMFHDRLRKLQDALENKDTANAKRYLLASASPVQLRNIETTGPDTSVANALLQLGDRETVLEYLRLCHNLWPKGAPAIDRWERAISTNRRPNFNNRALQ